MFAIIAMTLSPAAACIGGPSEYRALYKEIRALTFPGGARADDEALVLAIEKAVPRLVAQRAAIDALIEAKRSGLVTLEPRAREAAGAFALPELLVRACM